MQRSDFGLPADWSRVQDWLSFNGPVVIPFEKPAAVPDSVVEPEPEPEPEP